MTIFVLFFVELVVLRYSNFGGPEDDHGHGHEHAPMESYQRTAPVDFPRRSMSRSHQPGEDHMGHSRDHSDPDPDFPAGSGSEAQLTKVSLEDYATQMTALFVLEFGIIFHSIFIGLTLAVTASANFTTLYVVLVFHQTFEGLGLGTRLAITPWPRDKRWTPYFLGFGYAISTPIAIAVGLGLKRIYSPGSQTSLIVNGCFDSISAGILIYTGLVELMAHEFMFSNTMRKAPMRVVLSAFGMMCLGAGKLPSLFVFENSALTSL